MTTFGQRHKFASRMIELWFYGTFVEVVCLIAQQVQAAEVILFILLAVTCLEFFGDKL